MAVVGLVTVLVCVLAFVAVATIVARTERSVERSGARASTIARHLHDAATDSTLASAEARLREPSHP